MDEDQLDGIFNALADPTRRRILSMLLERDMAVGAIAEPFEISLAAISKHLLVLARAGLVVQKRQGRVKWCGLEPDGLYDALIWIEGFGKFERMNFDAFEAFLEADFGDRERDR
ncbi:MAG: metalloregulator ArsR/SmtB family transcription factor [Albidovulum sp.]|nr:metalloregulator ArsR/SmtB family transcription factor [Albidovulum sp.]